jgi:flagellar operon protein
MSVAFNPALLPPGVAPTGPATGQAGAAPPATTRAQPSGPSFAEVLRDAATGPAGGEPLRFSKHALARVQRRGIPLDPATLTRLAEGVGRAAGKGARDSVVLVDGTAFVVAVPSRTVVTAVGAAHMREQVFTNIDSAVIA